MNTYLNSGFDAPSHLKNSHLLFDTSAIIDILNFSAELLLNELDLYNSIPCYIHQVLLEIYATESEKERTRRQLFLSKYKFRFLHTIESHLRTEAGKLQEQLHKHDCHPQPTDLYLGAAIKQFTNISHTYLLTSNIKDFPQPVFKHLFYIPLVNNKATKVLAIIAKN